MDKYCYLNYQSKIGVDNQYSYEFWFSSSLVRVIGDRPFARGDVATIENIERVSQTETRIYVRVIGDPEIETMPDDFGDFKEIPTLLFLTTKIHLSPLSRYKVTRALNVDVLDFIPAEKNDNKSYTLIGLAKNKQAKVVATDEITGVSFEWIITDGVK